MMSRAQQSRDAALRRLSRVNRSLAVAALLGTGVITDVVANTASGHSRTGTAGTSASAGYKPALLVSGAGATGSSAQRRAAARPAARPRAAVRHKAGEGSSASTSASTSGSSQSLQSSPAPSASSSASSNVSAASSPPAVVAVSGGS